MDESIITVTSPLLPNLAEFNEILKQIWDSKWITNNGCWHQKLEADLSDYLGIPYISLFTNGTLPLITALQALRITGEVITTPYSFVATTHSLWWNGLKPVFVDVDPVYGNIDPNKIEAAITPHTKAIMPVHVYGNPCDTEKIQNIAEIYGLKVIYDAAHAFGVKKNDRSILLDGDFSTLSFHATKVYNTIEGGALISPNLSTKKRIDYLKNFGFSDETTVVAPGINSKLDEMRAAYGVLNLRQVESAIECRKQSAHKYREGLKNVPGIRYLDDLPRVKGNYSYFPIFVNEKEYGEARDSLYERLKANKIYGRRYFYPLISEFPMYRGLESSSPKNIPNAHVVANSVICLPMHAGLADDDIGRVINVVRKKGKV